MAGINVTLLWKGRLYQGLCGCEALGPHGHGVMCPHSDPALFFRQGKGE